MSFSTVLYFIAAMVTLGFADYATKQTAGRISPALGMLIYGEATDETDDRGRPIKGETLLLILNAGEKGITFKLPRIHGSPAMWAEMIDAAHRDLQVINTGCVEVEPFSLGLLRYGENRRMADEDRPDERGTVGGSRDTNG